MYQQEIPYKEWPEFFEQFGRLHHGKQAEITLVDATGGREHFANKQPLLGLLDEKHGSDGEAITVMIGGSSIGTSSHAVFRPDHVSASEWNDGFSAELQIHSQDGKTLVVQVGPAAQTLMPGVVTDGIQLEKS